jgi:CRP-like cAMP-binding protein
MNTPFGLRDLSLFDLVMDSQGEWNRKLTRVQYGKGKIVYQPGDPAKYLYLIHSGHVRNYRLSPEGREVTFGLLGSGNIFGELALISNAPQSAFAEIMDEAEISLLPRTDFEEMLRRRPDVAYNVMVRISERLHQAEDLIEDLVNRDVTSRVARTLLQLADRFGRPQHSGNLVIDLRLAYQEIANMVGSTRETVTRAISQMQQNNWVRLESGRLHLMDREALALLSE